MYVPSCSCICTYTYIASYVCIYLNSNILLIYSQIDNGYGDTGEKIFEVNFNEYDDVSNAFDQLFIICQRVIKVSSEEFKAIRNSCLARANEPLRGLIKHAANIHCLFEVLAENNKYCNWMDVRFLKTLAIACGNKNLQSLIENYTDVIYSKHLCEVWDYIPHYSRVRDKYYSEIKAKFGDRDPDSVTVKELISSKPQLAKQIAMLIAVVEHESLVVTWVIPTDEVYQGYLSFLTIPQQSRKDELIQFGSWVAYPPQSVLQKCKEEINCGVLNFKYVDTYVTTYLTIEYISQFVLHVSITRCIAMYNYMYICT